MENVYRREIMRGVELTAITAERFKTGSLSMTLLAPLERRTAALNAALPYVLRRGTASLTDMEAIAARLDELYGARIEPTLRKKGEIQCLGFYADFPDAAFLPEKVDVLGGVAKLMGELLLSPATRGGRLRADFVETERQNLIDDINAEINDKRGYAEERARELMFRGESYALSKLGTLSEAGKISVFTLTRQYKHLLSTAPLEVFYCGAESAERVERLVREALAGLPRAAELIYPVTDVGFSAPREPREVTEVMDVTQGRLIVGCGLGENMREPDHAALMVFNALLGGSALSKLYLTLRERLSLCYYAGSWIDRHKGALFISAGIDFAMRDETLERITEAIDEIRRGQIEDWELEGARREVVSSIYSASDEPAGLEGLFLDRAILKTDVLPDELAALASEVTGEELSSIARGITPEIVYFLSGEAEDEA